MLTRDDRNAIDGLFQRLEEAEHRSGARDAEAEALIRQKIAAQPSAPYYLAQTVVVQQAALQEAERRIADIQARNQQAERRGPWDRDQPGEERRQGMGLGGGGGFLGGAAQTALGVAGGMMLGNLIGSIFSTGSANASEFGGTDNASSDGGDTGGAGDDGGGDFDMGGDF